MNTRNDHRFVNVTLTVAGMAAIGAAFAYAGAPTPEPMPASHVVEATPTPQHYTVPGELRACVSEDEVPAVGSCVWRADEQGNGEGLSFIAHTDGSVTYIAE